MVTFGWRGTAGNIPILVALTLQVLSPFMAATIASVRRFPREHSEWQHRSLSAVKFLEFWVRDLFWFCSTSSSTFMRPNAVLFAETCNYCPFNKSRFVLLLSIPCNSHQTGLGSTPKQVPFQSYITGGMEYIPCYRMTTVMIKWENLDEVVTCLMVL